MANIFLAFFGGTDANAKLPPFYESFILKLQAAGHNVTFIRHTNFGPLEWGGVSNIPVNIRQSLENFKPDLCILFNNSFWDLSEVVNCPILIYTVDSSIYFANQSILKANPSRYFFVVDKDSKAVLKEKFGVKDKQMTLMLPFSAIKPEKRKIENNIVFIGSKFTSHPVSLINKFLEENPTDAERKEFQNALNYLKKNPFSTQENFISKKVITSQLVAKYFNINVFLMELSDVKRIEVLGAVADLGLTLYGTPNWQKDYFYRPALTLSYSNKKVSSIQENQDVYNSSKIGISASHLQAVSAFPWRTLDIMQSNACLVTDYHTDFDTMFPKNLFPVYKDAYEAREICKELLNDEYKRKKIVKNCQEFAQANFSFDKIRENINVLLDKQIL